MFRIALTVALILSLPLLAGCGGEEEPKTPDAGNPAAGTPPDEPPAETSDPVAEARKALESTIDDLKDQLAAKKQEAADLKKKVENLTVAELMDAAGLKERMETAVQEVADLQEQLSEKMTELENLGS